MPSWYSNTKRGVAESIILAQDTESMCLSVVHSTTMSALWSKNGNFENSMKMNTMLLQFFATYVNTQ